MRGKFALLVGLGVGYVLGSRAGRSRYEQIKRGTKAVWRQPLVQRGADAAKDFAGARAQQARDLIAEAAKTVISGSGNKKASSKSAYTASAWDPHGTGSQSAAAQAPGAPANAQTAAPQNAANGTKAAS